MKRIFKNLPLLVGIVLILTVVASGLAGCGGSNATGALTIVNGTQTKTLTMANIEALPVVSGSTGDITSSGTIEGPYSYKGVALTDILKSVGGITTNNAIRISAKDGYSMTMSYKQVVEGSEFPTYDSSTGKEASPSR